MGGYDANFVEEPQEYLKCIICHLVVKEPVLLVECGHRFCKSCFNEMKEHADGTEVGLQCPTCRLKVDVSKVYDDKNIARVVLDLSIKCSHYSEGCPWIGELRSLQIHLNQACRITENERTFLLQQVDKRLEEQSEKFCKELTSLRGQLSQQVEALSSLKGELKVFEKRIKLSEDKLVKRITLLEKNYEQCSKSAQKSGSADSPLKEDASHTNTSPYRLRRHSTSFNYVASAGSYNRLRSRSGKGLCYVPMLQEEESGSESSSQDETHAEVEPTRRYSLRDKKTSYKRSHGSMNDDQQ